jgi:hypothetical protein
MVTAGLNYRIQVPYNTNKREFVELNFDADEEVKGLLIQLIELVEMEKLDANRPTLDYLNSQKQDVQSRLKSLEIDMDEIASSSAFWYFKKDLRKKHRELNKEYWVLGSREEKLLDKINKLVKDSKYDTFELLTRFNDMLAELGFVATESSDDDSNQHKVIFECKHTDAKLKKLVEDMIEKYEQKKINSQENFNENDFENLM